MIIKFRKKNKFRWLFFAGILVSGLIPVLLFGQQPEADNYLTTATLENVIQYALKHQPLVQQSLIDEQVTETTIRSKLADWYPQLRFNYNLQHNFKVQTAVIGGNPIKLGVNNTSSAQFNLTQNIFDRDVLLARTTAGEVRRASQQTTSSVRIEVVVNTVKAFYDVLTSAQQIGVAEENILRLQRSVKDATSRYKTGITDKTDYKRATIALNNATAEKKSNQELLKAKTEYLKALIGYPPGNDLTIVYDSLQMESASLLDTLQIINYNNRIEFQLLETRKKLYAANVRYNKWSYLPSVSAAGAYNFNFQNDQFSKLFNTNYPNSYAALILSLPIFQGGKRKADIEQSRWELKRLEWDITSTKNNINAEYARSLAAYKSYLANYAAIKENLDLAKEVYDVIQLQYQSGLKTYLEVINAETDLRTARINYYNTLFQLLSSKIDVQRALGQINY
jgi:outer membrane protein TolC